MSRKRLMRLARPYWHGPTLVMASWFLVVSGGTAKEIGKKEPGSESNSQKQRGPERSPPLQPARMGHQRATRFYGARNSEKVHSGSARKNSSACRSAFTASTHPPS